MFQILVKTAVGALTGGVYGALLSLFAAGGLGVLLPLCGAVCGVIVATQWCQEDSRGINDWDIGLRALVTIAIGAGAVFCGFTLLYCLTVNLFAHDPQPGMFNPNALEPYSAQTIRGMLLGFVLLLPGAVAAMWWFRTSVIRFYRQLHEHNQRS